METIEISKIKVGANIRADYGDMDELVASIKENGIRQPLELDKSHNLIDGFRRLRAIGIINKDAAKQIDKVPYFVNDTPLDRVEEQLIAGMFQKNLTPMEEARAFKDYVNRTHHSIDTLAAKLGKTKGYIERRLQLNGCTSDVVKALANGEIEMGHAVILGQMTADQQKAILKEVSDSGMSVERLAREFEWNVKINVEHALDADQIKELQGARRGQQTLGVIEVDEDIGNKRAFRKDVLDYLEEQRKKLAAKGIKVFASEKQLLKEHPKAEALDRYRTQGYDEIVKSLPGSKEYAVVLAWEDEGMAREVVRLEPKKKEAKKESKASKEESEEVLALSAAEKLKNRAADYKRDVLVSAAGRRMKYGSVPFKALVVHKLLKHVETHSQEDVEACNETLKELCEVQRYGCPDVEMKDLLKMKPAELDKWIEVLAKMHINWLYEEDDLTAVTKEVGVDLKEDFVMDVRFAEMHTKDQAIKLAQELKVNVAGLEKKSDVVESIVKNWKKGQIPKVLERAK